MKSTHGETIDRTTTVPMEIGRGREERPLCEVVVQWGEGPILEATHLPLGGTFTVGEGGEGAGARPDFVLEGVGRACHPLVSATEEGIVVDLPAWASIAIHDADGALDDARLRACASLSASPGIERFVLPEGSHATIALRGLRLRVRAVEAADALPSRGRFDRRPFYYLLGSVAFHLMLFAIMALSPPKGGALGGDLVDTQSRLVQTYVAATESPPEDPAPGPADAATGNEGGESGERSAGEVGQAGDPETAVTGRRMGVVGDATPEEQTLALRSDTDRVRRTGALGVLASMRDAFVGPTSPYGADRAMGSDPVAALGALMGDQLGASSGFRGLHLTGTGAGAGGDGRGTVGMDRFGTIGTVGPRGRDYGVGTSGFRRRCTDCGTPDPVTIGRPNTRGSLSADVIRRVVRRHKNEVRFCYEQGLQRRPDLGGRVATRFVIGPSGGVTTALVAGSSLGDAPVEQCVTQAVRRWAFPAPDDGGVVTVTYPFVFHSAR